MDKENDFLVDEDHAKAALTVTLSYRSGDAKYALMTLITAIVILSESLEMDQEKTAAFVSEMITNGRKIEVDTSGCQPN